MPAARISMRQIIEVLRLKHEVGLSHDRIARACGLSKEQYATERRRQEVHVLLQLVDPDVPVEWLCKHPIETLRQQKSLANPNIPLPNDIYGPKRRNSRGVNLNIRSHYYPLMEKMVCHGEQYPAKPLLAFDVTDVSEYPSACTYPVHRRQSVGSVQWTSKEQATKALDAAWAAFPRWDATPVAERAAIVRILS